MSARVAFRRATLAIVAGMALASPQVAGAATFQVTTTDDGSDETCDSHCTLREAIDSANDSLESDTVLVPAGLYLIDGRLNVFAGEGGTITVIGAGAAGTIIDANGSDRVLKVHSGATADVSGVTLRGGRYGSDGGGVRVNGELTLSDSVVSFNAAGGGEGSVSGGGIANYGTLVLERTLVTRNGASDNGGGILNVGTAEIDDSAIDANVSDNEGGGIYSLGSLEIARSTISRNGSEDNGGGLYVQGSEVGDTATLVNTTVSGNDSNLNLGSGAGGAIFASGAVVDILNSTIARNQSFVDRPGGIAVSDGQVTVQNTIIADNRADAGEDNCDSSLTSGGGNLETSDDCGLDGPGDRTNVPAGLGPLADNGGPTLTHDLLPGSQAIEAALADGCPETDQRGGDRPPPAGSAGSACDIGAVESGALADLRLAFKSAAPSPATVGQRLTYTIFAVNDGPDAVTGARVTDDLPSGLTFVSASSTSGSCAGTDVVVCDLAPLASGEGALITIATEPTAPGVVANQASVAATVTDEDAANNTASVSVAVNPAGVVTPPPADLQPPQLNLRTRSTRFTLEDLLKGVVVTGGCPNGCSLRFRLLVRDASGNVSPSRFNQVIARSFAPFSTSTRTLRLRPCRNKTTGRVSRSCLRRLRRGLGNRRFAAQLESVATSGDGLRTKQVNNLRVR